jgi:hypothetical protein
MDANGQLTFTRASDATRVGPNGYIEKVRTNLLTYSQDFSDSSWVVPTTLTKTTGQTDPNGGTTALLVQNISDGNGYFAKGLTLTANVPHTASIYIKGAASGSVSIRIDDSTTGPQYNINYTTSWQRFSVTRTLNQTGCSFVVGGYGTWDIGTDIYFAFAQAEAGDIATDYIATTSAAVSVGPVSGTPRLDYLGSDCGRLLLEPQRSNLYPYSEQLNRWSVIGAPIVTANYATSPDGYTNADRVQFAAGEVVFNSGTGSAGSNTLSVYAKATNGTSAKFRFFGNGATLFSSEQTATGEWQRFTYTYTFASVTAGLAWPTSGTGATDVIFWGFQHEVAAYATSYIPTLGTAVTRVADLAQKTSASALIGQTEGTIFWEFEFTTSVATANEALLNIDNGSFGNTVYISKSASGGIVAEMYSGGVLQASLSLSSQPAGTYKAAIGYANNNTAFFVNGVQVGTTDTSCSVPAMNRIQLGNGVLGPSTDKTAQVLLFPTRLTNAQLAELTTL